MKEGTSRKGSLLSGSMISDGISSKLISSFWNWISMYSEITLHCSYMHPLLEVVGQSLRTNIVFFLEIFDYGHHTNPRRFKNKYFTEIKKTSREKKIEECWYQWKAGTKQIYINILSEILTLIAAGAEDAISLETKIYNFPENFFFCDRNQISCSIIRNGFNWIPSPIPTNFVKEL